MGFLKKLFGSEDEPDTSEADKLLVEEKRIADEEAKKASAIEAENLRKRKELRGRASGQQGGGRTGLMFGGNQQGV